MYARATSYLITYSSRELISRDEYLRTPFAYEAIMNAKWRLMNELRKANKGVS